jgi:phage terminase large subunit
LPTIRIPANNWRPRPHQLPAWNAWERGIKRSSLWWHRRFGKDEVALQKAAVAAHPSPSNPIPNARIANYWHCLPEYTQARKAIWTAINPHSGKLRIDEAFPHEVRENTRNDDMSITFKSGSSWRVVGSDNPNSLVGATPFGIVFSEWALSNPSTWGYLQPMLLENGGWADFITTPRGKNHAYELHKAAKANPLWFCETLTIDDTKAISPAQLAEAKKDYVALYGEDAAEALIQQEYYCSAEAAILGAYFGKEMAAAEREGRIKLVDADPNYPVHTSWDFGLRQRNSMVIWFFQVLPGMKGKARVLVVGCYAANNYGIGHYAEIIEDYRGRLKCEAGTDYVPHDGRQREIGAFGPDNMAKQRIEVMIECRLNPKVVVDHSIIDGISAVRQVLPICEFDEEACGQGLEGLRQYQTEWDDEKKIFSDAPLHNWASHYADSFRVLAMAFREVEIEAPKPKDRALTVGGKPVPGFALPTFDDLAKLKADEPRVRERV